MRRRSSSLQARCWWCGRGPSIARGELRFERASSSLRRDPKLVGYLLIVLTISFSTDPINTESPAFAHSFGVPVTWAGFVVGAFGAGAVAAALLIAGRVAGSRRRMAATLGLTGAGILLFSLSPWFGLGLVFVGLAGFGYLGSNASATSRLQLGVAENERGRIMALWSIAFLGVRPIASLIDGALAGAFGVRTAGVVMALPALGAAALMLRGVGLRALRPDQRLG